MNCPQIRVLIHAHHDGELDAANTSLVDQHLADCPHCFNLARNLGSLRTQLSDDALRFRAPANLRRQIRSAADSAARAERDSAGGGRRWWRLGQVAAVLMAAALGFHFWASPSEDRLLSDVTSSHVRSLMADHLTDVKSSDQHTVKPWFDGKIDFAPPVKDLRDSGFPLVGGRLDYLAGRPVAALVYARQKHLINLFVWPTNSSAAGSPPRTAERNGYHLVQWSNQNMIFWAVSDLNEKELMDFGRMLSGG
jgi:anti-sigma factor RsiW